MPPQHAEDAAVRAAGPADLRDAAQLLHDFNTEFGDDTPGAEALAQRIARLLGEGDTSVLLAGDGSDDPVGLAVLRFRPSIWSAGLECYLAELYVVPDRRGNGLGRALMQASIAHARERGADYMDLNTGEQDVAARSLYESLGFSSREGRPDGPVNHYYELAL